MDISNAKFGDTFIAKNGKKVIYFTGSKDYALMIMEGCSLVMSWNMDGTPRVIKDSGLNIVKAIK